MSKILFLESVAGIAGDMFAASFLDAGLVTAGELAALPGLLGLGGVEIASTRVTKATMRATHVTVTGGGDSELFGSGHGHHAGDEHPHPPHPHGGHHDHAGREGHAETHLVHSHEGHGQGRHTHYADIDRMLAESRLDAPVKELSRKIFHNLAEAEAAAHGMAIASVVFHEVGALDSIMDVVMAAYCIGKAGAARLCATPVKVGRGLVKMEHGTHPIPPPASVRLLVGMPTAAVPEAIARPNVELSTPTGLAILKTLAPQFQDSLPAGKVLAQGMGAGTMDLGEFPNVFRIVLIEETESDAVELPYERDRVVELACNIDDDTAEHIAWLAEQLLKMGALDVWISPVTGKKGRSAVVLTALASNPGWRTLADWILRNSSTFGVRHHPWDRLKLVRKFEQRAMPRGPVAYKIGLTTKGEFLKEKPEYEDVRKILES